VQLTGWERLDPIIAFAVGVNIIVAGFRLVAESTSGLLDRTLPEEENAEIVAVLLTHTTNDVTFHGLRTRSAGRHGFATFDVLVPGSWSVRKAHDLVEDIEADLREVAPDLDVRSHLEPREDPRAYGDHPIEIPILAPDGAEDGARATTE
jgi:divalent metal cation (Fe/Co/Zn/Cd) transporter